jgi:SAM-dependent methyltransferase
MNRHFVAREFCPACRSTAVDTLCRVGFDESPIREYLESFYAPQGAVEFEYLVGGQYILDECLECGLVYQREIPGDELMFKLYEQWIDPRRVYELHETKRTVDYYVYYAHEVENLIRYFGGLPADLRWLDFGMGWGNWCRIAAAYGCRVDGVELSQARIRHAAASGVRTIGRDEIPGQLYDFINTEQVFEHLPAPLETLRFLLQALRPGGVIKIGVPNGRQIKRRLELWDWDAPKGSPNSLNPVAPLEHINCFDHDRGVLVKMAARAGLEPLKLFDRYERRSLNRRIKDRLRPLYYRLTGQRKVPYTVLFFRKPDPSAEVDAAPRRT